MFKLLMYCNLGLVKIRHNISSTDASTMCENLSVFVTHDEKKLTVARTLFYYLDHI